MTAVPGAVFRYQDPRFQVQAAKLLPTQYLAVADGTALVTVLGSCVAACLRDPLLRIGGMNHFMLPDGDANDGAPARYGSHAMELLINDLLKRGASRRRLEAKVFGGANVLRGFTSNPVGSRNADFINHYLDAEGIPVLASDLGECARRGLPRWQCVVVEATAHLADTGRVMLQRLPHAHDAEVAAAERAARAVLSRKPRSGGVELFR